MLAHTQLHRPLSMRARAAQRSAGLVQCPISGARAAALFQSRRQQRRQARANAADDEDENAAAPSSPSGEDELARLLKADMERFSSNSASASSSASASTSASSNQQQQQSNEEGGVKATLDRLLVADFFAVLAALAWLGAGLAEKAAFGSTRLVDAWMPLWPLLWQPLIGVLMAGALVSGGAGWLASKQQEAQQEQKRR
jgi:cobalamin biosynthesis Mg chelatase CobN